ncbi:MAG: class I SAM-dependent methyltransferase, partial [Cycloclasticus sp.]|nr:class I SAM-dependent methyltransferase [Cycloclasticus sp.]
MFNRILSHLGKKRAVSKALRCQGWTSLQKLSLLHDLVAQTGALEGDILEIGSAWGRSAVLLGHASDKRIWSIDPHTGGRAFVERGENQSSFDIFKENLVRNKLDNRVKILKHTTAEVIENGLLPATVKFSFIFIDGLHSAEGVELDFKLAFDRLVPNGIMSFDDYAEESIPDYTEMIDALIFMRKLTLIKDATSG